MDHHLMETFEVYKVVNTTNQKIYIGCTGVGRKRRFKQHCARDDNTILSKAIKKHGVGSFYVELIEECESRQDMFEREIYYIRLHKANNTKSGYNMTKGGDSGPTYYGEGHPRYGKKNPKLVALNKSRAGVPLSSKHRQKLIESNIGRRCSTKTKRAMAESRKTAWEQGLYAGVGEKISMAKKGVLSKKRIPLYCETNGVMYSCAKEAADALDLNAGNICNVVNGKYRHTKGFAFVKARIII